MPIQGNVWIDAESEKEFDRWCEGAEQMSQSSSYLITLIQLVLSAALTWRQLEG